MATKPFASSADTAAKEQTLEVLADGRLGARAPQIGGGVLDGGGPGQLDGVNEPGGRGGFGAHRGDCATLPTMTSGRALVFATVLAMAGCAAAVPADAVPVGSDRLGKVLVQRATARNVH